MMFKITNTQTGLIMSASDPENVYNIIVRVICGSDPLFCPECVHVEAAQAQSFCELPYWETYEGEGFTIDVIDD